MENNLEYLKILVENFRLAIKLTDKSKLTGSCVNFPNGSCDDASILLARYLSEKGNFDIKLVKGGFDNKTHNWLEVDDFIVDITAKQFNFIDKYIVSSNSDWHNQLVVHSKINPCIENYDNYTRNSFLKAYKAILANLKEV